MTWRIWLVLYILAGALAFVFVIIRYLHGLAQACGGAL